MAIFTFILKKHQVNVIKMFLTYPMYVPEHVDDSCSKLKGTEKEKKKILKITHKTKDAWTS